MQPARSSRPRFPAAESPSVARRGATAAVAIGVCALGSGCFLGDVALPPPPDTLYYPTGLVRSPGGTALYVINSDFDLQYDGGTVVALDLAKLRTKLTPLLTALREVTAGTKDVEQACLAGGTTVNTNVLNPGPCLAISLSAAQESDKIPIPSATIGAFASGGIFVQRKGSTPDARLFIPVRGDPSITFFDVKDDDLDNNPLTPGAFSDALDCTGVTPHILGERCNNKHRIGVEPFESTRAIILPTEPVGIAASEDGTAIVVAHQTEKSVSLTIDDPALNTPTIDGTVRGKPTLEFVLGGLADGPTDVGTVPIPALIKAQTEAHPPTIDYQRGFLVTYHNSAVIDLVRVHKDESGTSRPFLTRSNETAIGVNGDGRDSRGIAVDSSARAACETGCGGVASCLVDCVRIPIDIFVANRSPPSLLIGRVETTLIPEDSPDPTAAFDRVFITNSIPLSIGASKVAIGQVIDAQGHLARRVFTGTFDSRSVFSFDPVGGVVDRIITTGRGPHALTFDHDEQSGIKGAAGEAGQTGHAFLLVGHFTDSYLGVVDLDMRHPESFGTMFASVGTPTPPKASK
jgi:DNA-binding beta-propeller fold protein YncE